MQNLYIYSSNMAVGLANFQEAIGWLQSSYGWFSRRQKDKDSKIGIKIMQLEMIGIFTSKES